MRNDKKSKDVEKVLGKIYFWLVIAILLGIPFLITEEELFFIIALLGIFIICLLQIKLYLKYNTCINFLMIGGFKIVSGKKAFNLFLAFLIIAIVVVVTWIYYLLQHFNLLA
ncbi:hypothetical protein [Natronospora cellulosivora (SeqCode)]